MELVCINLTIWLLVKLWGNNVCINIKLPESCPDGVPSVFCILVILLKLWFGNDKVNNPVPIYTVPFNIFVLSNESSCVLITIVLDDGIANTTNDKFDIIGVDIL